MKRNNVIIVLKLLFCIYVCIALLSCFNVLKCMYSNGIDNNSVELSSRIETELGTHILFRDSIINVNGMVRNALKIKTMNYIIKLDNGHLSFTNAKTPDDILANDARNLYNLYRATSDKGIPMIYISAPFKIAKDEQAIPISAKNQEFTNENVDRFLALLDEYNVEYIDMRKKMIDDGINQYDYFFRTDHHWNIRAGLYTYKILEDWLCENLDCTVDDNVSSESSYRFENYRKYHLGSSGLRTGTFFAGGADDFEIVIPTYDVCLEKADGTVITDFMDYYNKDQLLKKSYQSSFYDRLFQDTAIEYTNHLAQNDKKILVIGDSMSLVVYPFLALGYKNINCVWNSNVNNQLYSYIDEYKPDAIVMIYYPTSLGQDAVKCFDFGAYNE